MSSRRYPVLAALLFLLVTATVFAQEGPPQGPPRERGGFGGPGMEGRGTFGVIKEIKPGELVLEGREGKTETVKIGSDTAFRKDGQAAKLEDFKVGDRVAVMGDRQGDAWKAQQVMSGRMGMRMNPEDMGKKFIAGEVTKIEDTKLTIHRVDGQDQVIEVDENTSFRNSKRESITLADIKVGDNVAGRGEVKDGVFFPAVLNVGNLPFMRRGEPNSEVPRVPPQAPPK